MSEMEQTADNLGAIDPIVAASVLAVEDQTDMIVEAGIAMLKTKQVFGNDADLAEIFFKKLRKPNPERPAEEQMRLRLRKLMLAKSDREPTDREFLVAKQLQLFNSADYEGFAFSAVDQDEVRVQRHQLTGLCYLHAPIVLRHYALHRAGLKTDMVDLTKYILSKFTPDALRQYVFEGYGGDSEKTLRSFLQAGTVVTCCRPEDAPEMMKHYGPLLVSKFEVFADFMDPKIKLHEGQPTGERRGFHAMLVVGTKQAGDKLHFLLQNWWLEKQFVVVDMEYLKACNANLHFIETTQTHVVELPTHPGKILQTEAFDTSDCSS